MSARNSFGDDHPELVKEWHPTKNGERTPFNTSAVSNYNAWWLLPYDDPITGKHFDFEWQAKVYTRDKGAGCPYISGRALYKGFNDLVTRFPEVADQWHPTKNGRLKPEDFLACSGTVVWLYLHYYDETLNKWFDFEWQDSIAERTSHGHGCPFLFKTVWTGFNDIVTRFPEVAAQWHPTKNGDMTPDKVHYGCGYKYWWYLPYDDPETGKHFDFEWEASVAHRTLRGDGCPFISGNHPAVWKGYNDLQSRFPEIAKEWHPTKNKKSPDQVTYGSGEKAWWYLPYDDPITGKHFDFEWEMSISSRTGRMHNKCPFLSGRAVYAGFNDLQTRYPAIAEEWHPTKNGDLTPDKVTYGSNKVVWWYFPYDDSITGKHFDFEWEEAVTTRTNMKTGCPFLSGRAVWTGFNDLKTRHPLVAKLWHPVKNGKLTSDKVTAGITTKVWWYLPYDDPVTGKHFNFEWESPVGNMVSSNGSCPFLTGQLVWPGFNDVLSKCPDVAREWNYKRNKKNPEEVLYTSQEIVWWYLPYDDPVTGKHFDFEWKAGIYGRTIEKRGCPYLNNTAVWPGYNDLKTLYPEIASEWHPTKNGKKKPEDYTPGSGARVWWVCPKCGHEYYAKICSRTSRGSGCPECANEKRHIRRKSKDNPKDPPQ